MLVFFLKDWVNSYVEEKWTLSVPLPYSSGALEWLSVPMCVEQMPMLYAVKGFDDIY